MKNLCVSKVLCLAATFCIAAAIDSPAQIFKTLVSFDGANGSSPFAGVVQGADGYFYGTTAYGGTNYTCSAHPRGACGTVFKMSAAGTLTTLYNFSGTTGYDPQAPLILAANGDFYGTTMQGGNAGAGLGTIFKMTPGGTFSLLYTYTSENEGAYPDSALVQASNGDLYGVTRNGGSGTFNPGTVFKISGGTLTVLHNFDGSDGSLPYGLVLATDGDFYGVTNEGGANNHGTIFKITAAGTLTTLYSFCSQANCTDGSSASAPPVQGKDGDFYGTAYQGGAYGDGIVYKMTPAGLVTTLHSFSGTDGISPTEGLVRATDGNFYGMTVSGGAGSFGTVYKITPAGALTTLHNFHLTDGAFPTGTLLQATNGVFYGATETGGSDGIGTIFSLDVGLGPDSRDGAPKR